VLDRGYAGLLRRAHALVLLLSVWAMRLDPARLYGASILPGADRAFNTRPYTYVRPSIAPTQGPGLLRVGPFSCPYSPKCPEGEFSEVHFLKICYLAYKKWATWQMRTLLPTFILS
jgi:hypothetical protein